MAISPLDMVIFQNYFSLPGVIASYRTAYRGRRKARLVRLNLVFRMELRRHAQGAPGHAYPRSSAWNSGVQDHLYKVLKYMFLASLHWDSGSTIHKEAQVTHFK